MIDFNSLSLQIETELRKISLPTAPSNLYEPISYMLQLGGKRIRPLAVLLANHCFKGQLKEAMPAALAVEVFHNFTLMHDDIMDNAPLRRGQVTVHEKWNSTIAILSGDTMMVKAYELIAQINPTYLAKALVLFNQTAIEVCEGQQMDMDFEQLSRVNVADYIEMIRLKTAVLLAASLQLGAMSAGASTNCQQEIYDFGINLGIAFQLQDDYLDCYADAAKFGKQVGGDILSNKKTFLLINALERASGNVLAELNALINGSENNHPEKIAKVLRIYQELGVDVLTENAIQDYSERAIKSLESVEIPEADRAPLKALADMLMVRKS